MPTSHSLKSVLQTLRQVFYIVGYSLCRLFVRPKDGFILFLSDSHAVPTGNAQAVIEHLKERNFHVESFMRQGLRVRRTLRQHMQLVICMAQARVILVDDFTPMIYQIKLRPGTQLLQLWHASGAFKTMGFSRIGKPGGPIKGSKTHKNYTAAIVSSESVRPNFAQAFGIDLAKVHATGIPRTDPFFDQELVAKTAASVRNTLRIPADKKLLLFAPTFRGNGQLTAHYDHSQLDWSDFADRFGSEYVIGVRMHPFVKDNPPILDTDPRFLDLGDYPDPNALLMATDLLITDYSSIIFDYALLARPVVFFCPDLEQYTASRDFYYPFTDYTYGLLTKDYPSLVHAVKEAVIDQDELQRFLDFFVGACDGSSTTRVVEQLIVPFLGDPSKIESTSLKDRLAIIGATAVRVALAGLYAPLKLLPTRNKVTLISRQTDTPSVDFQLLKKELGRQAPDWEVTTLTHEFHSSLSKKISYVPHVLTQMRHIATSRVVIVDTYCIPISALTHKKSLRVIQTWHAMGAFKKFGYSILGQGEGASSGIAKAMAMHRNYSAVLASSQAAVPYFAQAFRVPREKVVVAPLPRVDLLTNKVHMAAQRKMVIGIFPELATGKNILFAPTFRKGQTFDSTELEAFFAQSGYNFIAKPHPVSLGAGTPNRYGALSAFELLAVADYLVTDYSSIMVEAAVAGVPVFILAPDLESYREKRSFYIDFEHEVPSPISTSFDELLVNLQNFDGDLTNTHKFAARWVQTPPHQSCTERVISLALNK